MPRQSPHTVTYKDVHDLAVQVLRDIQGRRAAAVARGTTNLEALTHQVETAKVLVRMLKKGIPAKQTDFLTLFKEVTR